MTVAFRPLPEFEMALYTTCFLVGEEDNYTTLDTGVDVLTSTFVATVWALIRLEPAFLKLSPTLKSNQLREN